MVCLLKVLETAEGAGSVKVRMEWDGRNNLPTNPQAFTPIIELTVSDDIFTHLRIKFELLGEQEGVNFHLELEAETQLEIGQLLHSGWPNDAATESNSIPVAKQEAEVIDNTLGS